MLIRTAARSASPRFPKLANGCCFAKKSTILGAARRTHCTRLCMRTISSSATSRAIRRLLISWLASLSASCALDARFSSVSAVLMSCVTTASCCVEYSSSVRAVSRCSRNVSDVAPSSQDLGQPRPFLHSVVQADQAVRIAALSLLLLPNCSPSLKESAPSRLAIRPPGINGGDAEPPLVLRPLPPGVQHHFGSLCRVPTLPLFDGRHDACEAAPRIEGEFLDPDVVEVVDLTNVVPNLIHRLRALLGLHSAMENPAVDVGSPRSPRGEDLGEFGSPPPHYCTLPEVFPNRDHISPGGEGRHKLFPAAMVLILTDDGTPHLRVHHLRRDETPRPGQHRRVFGFQPTSSLLQPPAVDAHHAASASWPKRHLAIDVEAHPLRSGSQEPLQLLVSPQRAKSLAQRAAFFGRSHPPHSCQDLHFSPHRRSRMPRLLCGVLAAKSLGAQKPHALNPTTNRRAHFDCGSAAPLFDLKVDASTQGVAHSCEAPIDPLHDGRHGLEMRCRRSLLAGRVQNLVKTCCRGLDLFARKARDAAWRRLQLLPPRFPFRHETSIVQLGG
eukprot:scaffold447_cov307-Pinguiococcus_pyrenoidosus.AAC.49